MEPCGGVQRGVSVMDPNYQESGRHPQRREARPPGEQWGWGPIMGVPWSAPPNLLLPLQILGLTFAMTMYCQVVKADTYCA